jgi:hypothetical protein
LAFVSVDAQDYPAVVYGSRRPGRWGMTVMIYAELMVGIPRLAEFALSLFIITAVGGIAINLMFRTKCPEITISLIVAHGFFAASAFVLLLCSAF